MITRKARMPSKRFDEISGLAADRKRDSEQPKK